MVTLHLMLSQGNDKKNMENDLSSKFFSGTKRVIAKGKFPKFSQILAKIAKKLL